MGTIRMHTTAFDANLDVREGETVLETLRRHNLPAMGFLLSDADGGFVSLTDHVEGGDQIEAHSLRNPDFTALNPALQLARSADPVAEIFAADGADQRPTLLQFNREEGIDYIYASFKTVLDGYLQANPDAGELQVALSGGGDGRIVGECAGRYQEETGTVFAAVITANGFEDERAHLESAVAIAERFALAYEVFDEAASAAFLKIDNGFAPLLADYRDAFPGDEAEVMATYWVQQLDLAVAKKHGRKAILFGYNQEDVIAEKLYQALVGTLLPPYPVRSARGVDLIAPLYKAPKKLIDALDLVNSMKNYDRRVASVSYLRSSCYFAAYNLIERFPSLALAMVDPAMLGSANAEIPDWLRTCD